MRGAEAAVGDVFPARVVVGEGPEVRAIDAPVAVAEAVERFDRKAGALRRPFLHPVETIERKRIDRTLLPGLERPASLRHQPRDAVERLAVAKVGVEVSVRLAVVQRRDHEPWHAGPFRDRDVLRLATGQLLDNAGDGIAL